MRHTPPPNTPSPSLDVPPRDDADAAAEGHALTDVLERLEASLDEDPVRVGHIVEGLGQRSFPALVLVPALLAVSPLSGIPGVTVTVGLIVAFASAQMILGRRSLWLPGFLADRTVPSARVAQAASWLRRPLGFIERFLKPRLTPLVRRPLVYLPLLVMLAIGCAMPVLEIIPTSGSIAAAAVSLMAIGLLTRDGVPVLLGLAATLGVVTLILRVAG
jgi:hypothetical protein